MDGDIAMEEWKDPNHRGADYLMPPTNFLADAFPPAEALGREGGGSNVVAAGGFERHGLSVAVGSPPPPEERRSSLPPTPQFGQRFGSGSGSGGGGGGRRLADRRARGGFSHIARISVPCNPPPAAAAAPADVSSAGAPSPYVTIPPGLSPTTLLESPIFLSNAMGQASPTTGKLHMLGGVNDNDPIRFGAPPTEEVSGAFSFKPLNLTSSHYTAAEKSESLPNNQYQSLPRTQVSVKTEANTQTAQEAANQTSQSQLMQQQQQFNGQVAVVKSGCKISRAAPDNAAGGGASPPDHGQAAEGDGKGDSAAVASAAAAALTEDGYSWRKYGQKQVKHSEYPRSYYKCTHADCVVKKKVERSHEGHVTEIIYKGTHNHAKPAASRRPPAHPSPGDAQVDHAPDGGGNAPAAVAGAAANAGGQASAEARQLWHSGVGGEGLEVTSSPSVPGELCDSTASMQVQDGAGAATQFESPDGVDVTSAVSDEVERDEKVTHVLPAAADGESDELERKRRKLESCAIEMNTASRAVREPRVVIQTTSEVDILDDGYRWRKYGQKVVKGNPNPRSYYKCTHQGCLVRKHVERASHDLKSVITTYEGKHNHEVPAARNSGHPAGGSAPPGGGAGSSQPHAGARRPEVPSMQDSLMRLGGCGASPFAPHFGLHLPPPRDPLATMSNFPYALGHAPSPALPSLPPPPPGLGGVVVEGLKYPMLAPPSAHHPLLRHRQGGMETVIPKGEIKQKTMPATAAAPAVYQQAMSRVSLRNQL
ncbi:probable WRKY transcription factor 2 [Oryza brachyantha]|uniref:probable WRKY transcription factor 2 n=1 Tax=Oryza brachyantha TaxID=4533 RepID=UPI001ADB5B13|nr:probable WRKY transcription factor 2 [Oryza brachyantha]